MTVTNNSRALIVTGGNIGDWTLALLPDYTYIVGVDRGAAFLALAGCRMQLALGDFDSIHEGQLDIIRAVADETLVYDADDKDWTDTELAFREVVNRGFLEIDIAGALGNRFDHSLANVHLLKQAQELGCSLRLIDANNEIRLCTDTLQLAVDARYPNVSLLPLTEQVTGITLEGFKYPLHEATIRLGQSLGISNVLVEQNGTISIASGLALVIRSRD